jgi:membrane protein required for colicin V production
MTVFDYAVLLIVGISILLSVMRGLVREAFALLGWVAAFLVANGYTWDLAPLLPQGIPGEAPRLIAAFVILFLGTLLVASLVTIALAEIIRTIGLGALDKGLGAVFGLARGILIVMVAVLLGGLTALPRQDFWRNAMFSAPLEALAGTLKPWLPENLASRINYD